MQALQRTIQTIARQFKELTPTAKMLMGSLVIILVMSLFLVSLYAGRHDMLPLGLGPSVSADARAQAVAYLKSSGIPYEISGTDLLIPSEMKFTVLAHLTESQIVGGDQINFDRLMSDDNLFRTRDQNRQRFLVAKMNMLGMMISQMSGIERATVVIAPSESANAIGRSNIPPSASVTVLARGAEVSQQQVDAIARLVAGSHAGLKPQHVSIVDSRTGRALQARTDDLMAAGKYMEVKLDTERHAKSTIENALGYIPGVRISVNAQVDTTRVEQEVIKHDEPKIAPISEETTEINSTGHRVAADVGVGANTGMSIANAATPSNSTSDQRTRTSTVPFVGTDSMRSTDSKGYALQINASIGVPKSYFVRLYQDQAGDPGAQPDATQLSAIVQTETDRIKSHVTPLIDTQAMDGASAGIVSVSMIPDFGSPMSVEASLGDLVNADGGAQQTERLVKYVGLGGLGVISLFMMFLMARKVGMRQHLPSPAELVGIPPALAAVEADVVGEADEASPALEGLELNDDAIRRQQMLSQITEMVTSTPDDAANLMRRWMKSDA